MLKYNLHRFRFALSLRRDVGGVFGWTGTLKNPKIKYLNKYSGRWDGDI